MLSKAKHLKILQPLPSLRDFPLFAKESGRVRSHKLIVLLSAKEVAQRARGFYLHIITCAPLLRGAAEG